MLTKESSPISNNVSRLQWKVYWENRKTFYIRYEQT